MAVDYRELCLRLFGTDNVEELTRIADSAMRRNPRGAGRKRKYSDEEIQEMASLRDHGMTLEEIAKKYGTSRQVIGRLLTNQPRSRHDRLQDAGTTA